MPIDPREWLQNSASPSSDRVGEESARSADEADAEVARTIALRKLAARARTRYELDQALQAKNVPPSVKDAVLDRMQEVGLVDDASFAADWVASRQQRRHLSRRALRRELEAKGVERSDIDSARLLVHLLGAPRPRMLLVLHLRPTLPAWSCRDFVGTD